MFVLLGSADHSSAGIVSDIMLHSTSCEGAALDLEVTLGSSDTEHGKAKLVLFPHFKII